MVTNSDIIRAWKDEENRMSLSEEQRSSLPAHPPGPIQLSDEELSGVDGGLLPTPICTFGGIRVSILHSCIGTCECRTTTPSCSAPSYSNCVIMG